MAQGKSKTKAQLPANVKAKKKFSSKSKVIAKARPNAPVAPKLTGKAVDAMKMKKAISKGVSEAMENELRAKAFDGKKSLLTKKEMAEKAAASK
ncbi:3-isopropylmalate dehydrogenase 1, chloroplastic [Frankliniella fusca]|uniref:3-isopropylmalate dehydrogenase 1, chloroplastic n=1 Tax=Frankliniella fusca TaxID=407009 RepID=A0AAE1HDJ2_9NEOP|nr:3-isopropylmalate dehydrogenase 1, chloroplastic [Frankliniella fusca]